MFLLQIWVIQRLKCSSRIIDDRKNTTLTDFQTFQKNNLNGASIVQQYSSVLNTGVSMIIQFQW